MPDTLDESKCALEKEDSDIFARCESSASRRQTRRASFPPENIEQTCRTLLIRDHRGSCRFYGRPISKRKPEFVSEQLVFQSIRSARLKNSSKNALTHRAVFDICLHESNYMAKPKPKPKRGGPRANAGRPKGPAKVKLGAYVLPQTKAKLDSRAEAESKSVGEVIDDLIEP